MKIQIVKKFDVKKLDEDKKFFKTGEAGKILYEFLDFHSFIRHFYKVPNLNTQKEINTFWKKFEVNEETLNSKKILEFIDNSDLYPEIDIENFEVKMLDKNFGDFYFSDFEEHYKKIPLLVEGNQIECSGRFEFISDICCMGIWSNGEFLIIPHGFGSDGFYHGYVFEKPISFLREGYKLLIDEIPIESISKSDCVPDYVEFSQKGNFRIWKQPQAEYIVLERLF
ncbi:hypothetical protein [Helicobacter sp. 11S03491-1]|uniref:hypothetical protein n=1 Tax=Helicobacter sp. 11S03491-1 TaxID=1476196 RepID=UPI000BA51A75|nr:hypothetical protein [Helicobacter sp. 11S03491-1]PAF42164.1 hypothetical protein BKH45_04245 [Helicobacter sp. 11S03491-1]